VINTGSLDTGAFDSLLIEALFSAAAAGAPAMQTLDADTNVQLHNRNVGAAATTAIVGMSPGGGWAGDSAAGYGANGPGVLVPARTRVVVNAAGAGVTTRLVILGRRNRNRGE
jgi:hypothetical protein